MMEIALQIKISFKLPGINCKLDEEYNICSPQGYGEVFLVFNFLLTIVTYFPDPPCFYTNNAKWEDLKTKHGSEMWVFLQS